MGRGEERSLGLLFVLLCSAGTGESATPCGGALTANTGAENITYTTSLDQPCVWTITAANVSHTVLLTLFDLNIEEGDECLVDSLRVYDGSESTGQLVATWCGQMAEERVQSSGPTLTLVYTVTSNNTRGFDVEYMSMTSMEKCEFIPDGKDSYVFIRSQGYPQNYPQNLYCTYEFKAARHKQMKVEFLNVDLPPEVNGTCTSDHVAVYDGDMVKDIELKSINTRKSRTCGTDLPVYISSGEYLLLVFNTSEAGNYKGFRLRYMQGNFSNEYIPPCGGDLIATDTPKLIESPNYPNGYPRRLACKWTIRAANSSLAIRAIIVMNITGYTSSSSECFGSTDELNIYDGTNTDDNLATLCGVHPVLDKRTLRNAMTAVFTTRFTETDVKGFLLIYKQTDEKQHCLTVTHHAARYDQYLTSTNYPRMYLRNAECTWRLTGDTGDVIVLEVVMSNIEKSQNCSNDWVTVYDGYFDTDPILGKWCGNETGTYRSTGTSLSIVLHSNANEITGWGFRMKFKTEEKFKQATSTAAQTLKMEWSVMTLELVVLLMVCSRS